VVPPGLRVRSIKSIQDMNLAPVRRSRRPDFERFLRHCAQYWKIAPKVYPRGVFKFRSIEEAEEARGRR
jgi:hypothetical protein